MKKLFFTLFVLCIGANTSFSQFAVDTLYFDKDWKKTQKNDRYFTRIIKTYNGKTYTVKDFYPSGNKLMEGTFIQLDPEVKDGYFYWWHDNGKKKKEVLFEVDVAKKTEDFDEKGKYIPSKTIIYTENTVDGKRIKDIRNIDRKAMFQGGEIGLGDYLRAKMNYPDEAIEDRIGGKVQIAFYITEEGKAINPIVIKKVHPSIDEQAIKMVKKMPKWIPAMENGKPIGINYTITINFDLANELRKLEEQRQRDKDREIQYKGVDFR